MAVAGIEVATTQVGDRHVLAELLSRGWAFGGEQSGHIIDTGFVPAGDGTAAALLTLEALARRRPDRPRRDGEAPAEARERARARPRRARAAPRTSGRPSEEEHRALEGRGRVLVRPSGTEPLVRVMVEAPTADECEEVCDRLAHWSNVGWGPDDWRRASTGTGRSGTSGLTSNSRVRHHRIRRAARVPRPASGGSAATRVPRLRLSGPLPASRTGRSTRSARWATSQHLRDAVAVDRTATCAAPPASATRAGPRTAA